MENKKLIMMFAAGFSLVFAILYYGLFAMIGNVSATSPGEKTLYMNQVGLYREEKSIDGMKADLQASGIDSYTWSQDDLQAVVCGVSFDEAQTKAVQETLKAAEITYIEKSVTVSDAQTLELIDQQSYQEALERIGK